MRPRHWVDTGLGVAGVAGLVTGVGLVTQRLVVAGVVCLVLGFAALVLSVFDYYVFSIPGPPRYPRAVRHGTPAEGTIIAIRPGNERWRELIVRFTTEDGVDITARNWAPDPKWKPADKDLQVRTRVTVRYDPDNPQDAMIQLPSRARATPPPGVAYGRPKPVVPSGAGARMKRWLLRPERTRQAVRNGIPAEGTIIAVMEAGTDNDPWRELSVRFTTEDDVEVTAQDYVPVLAFQRQDRRLAVGSPVSLHYNPDKPEQVRIALPSEEADVPDPGVTYRPDPPRADPRRKGRA